MKKKVLEFIRKNKLVKKGNSVVLGVSGGADSICMLKLLSDLQKRLGISLYVLHINHMIRGEEADQDAAFVKKICTKFKVPHRVINVDVPALAEREGLSEEEAGRYVRYDEFSKYAYEVSATKIAVAHNSNDNAETVLMNLARGTGIKGLGGIPPKREMEDANGNVVEVIRPILCLSRKEIEDYLKENEIEYRNDSTNDSTDYTRNKIRLEIMPLLENINDNAMQNITNASNELADTSNYIEKDVDEAYEEFVTEEDGKLFLSDESFAIDPIVLTGVIRKMIENIAGKLKDITRIHVGDVVSLSEKQVGKKIDLPYSIVAEREYEGISMFSESNETESETKNKEVIISFEEDDFDRTSIEELKYTKWLDYDKIDDVVVRTRQKGDYIVIDGDGATKKLKKYFIDEKIPRRERDEVLLVADGNHILWVVGYRISEDVKVTSSTKKVVKLEYKGE
ncbi:MAG TPA: tRNA lysidine(34) synthetase TilS [Eubacterium sp.]|nr:tRNA lysidine(34) synthetase TilS [Eubacterium sp.]